MSTDDENKIIAAAQARWQAAKAKREAEHAQAEAERLQKAASRTIRSFGVKPNDEMRDRHLEQTPWRGCGYLPICGNHPGTPMLVIMILAGAAAGGWHGGIMLSLLFGPIYLIGAHGRSILVSSFPPKAGASNAVRAGVNASRSRG